MVRRPKKGSRKAGLPPGTVVHVGEKRSSSVVLSLHHYNASDDEYKPNASEKECLAFRDKEPVTWINVDGVQDTELIQKLGEGFGLHPLVLEDIAHTHQRPKVEDFGSYLYVVLKMLSFREGNADIQQEQISLILGQGFLLSFQERPGDVFDTVRDRIRSHRGRIRDLGADYLLYTLMDTIVDHYFTIMETLGERIESMEDALLEGGTAAALHEIHRLRSEIISLRRAIWPTRDVVAVLERRESPLIEAQTTIYLRDVHDHAIRVMDMVETFREMLSGMLEIYLTSVNNRMNEVMKILTVMATIFIPLTFIASIYGMNFEFMPELKWRWSYPLILLIMGGCAAGMWVYFRRKKWL